MTEMDDDRDEFGPNGSADDAGDPAAGSVRARGVISEAH